MGRRMAVWAIVVAGLGAALVVGLAHHSSAGTGRKAPALPREVLSGQATTLTSLLSGAHGRPVAVVYWASWCPPCQKEAPAYEAFARSAAGSGRVVGVDWEDGLAGAREFVRRHGWTFPNLRDAEGTIGSAYGLTGLPTTFVVRPDGRISAALRGPQTSASLAHALEGR